MMLLRHVLDVLQQFTMYFNYVIWVEKSTNLAYVTDKLNLVKLHVLNTMSLKLLLLKLRTKPLWRQS